MAIESVIHSLFDYFRNVQNSRIIAWRNHLAPSGLEALGIGDLVTMHAHLPHGNASLTGFDDENGTMTQMHFGLNGGEVIDFTPDGVIAKCRQPCLDQTPCGVKQILPYLWKPVGQ